MQSALHSVIGPKKEIHDLNGRVALITGGALGIGLVNCPFLETPTYSSLLNPLTYIISPHSYEIARAFVLNGARVIMVNRKEEQGQDAIKKIKEEAGEKAQIEWLGCDMGNLKEVKEVFTGIREREERLDLVWPSPSSLPPSS
jgi:hypothetical protein